MQLLTRGGRLQEVPNMVVSLGNFWYFGKLVAEEKWLLTRGGGVREVTFVADSVKCVPFPIKKKQNDPPLWVAEN